MVIRCALRSETRIDVPPFRTNARERSFSRAWPCLPPEAAVPSCPHECGTHFPTTHSTPRSLADAKKLQAEGPPGIGSDPWQVGLTRSSETRAILIDPTKWDFAKKSRWLYTYLLGKLNTELHSKTVGVEGKNGFEVYRQICNIVDAIPANYQFYLDS